MSYFGNNAGFMFNSGVTTPPVFQKPTMENPAMEGKNAELLKGTSRGVFEVTDVEAAAALCTHKNAQNFIVEATGKVDENGFPVYFCNWCKEQFPIWENLSLEDVQNIVNKAVFLLQNIKFFGVDLAGDFLSVYAQMIPYIKKLPKVYEVAINSFSKFSSMNTNIHSNNNNFAMLQGILGGNYNFGMGANPAMNMNYGANQNPAMNQNWGMPQGGVQFGMPQGMPQGGVQFGANQNPNMMNMGMGGYDTPFAADPMQNNFQTANNGFNMRNQQAAPANNGVAANKKAFED